MSSGKIDIPTPSPLEDGSEAIAETEDEMLLEKTKKLVSQSVALVGLGYVGLPLALLATRKGYKVIGVDKDTVRLELLAKEASSFMDDDTSQKLQGSSLETTDDISRIKETSVVVICVPTPVNVDLTPNLEPLRRACEDIAPFLQKGQLIVLESTVSPSVSEDFVLPILENGSGFTAGEDFYLAHCPERINPGDQKWNV